MIPSPKDVPTYDLKPQMSAPEVADECKARIESGKYDVIVLNFANCDMVGHTGVFDSAVKAVEAVDAAVNEVVTAVLNAGGCVFLTADHGNAEKMKNPDGTPFTAHTTNGAVCGHRLRRCEAARGRLPGRYRPHHAALYRPAGTLGDDR